ncbi:alpha/beta fold hydrolase [Streptomyces coeruleorubidus]|uniref:alpha/beta fold hydrolase n=1 Tax=Streptomyces coeruleorubidus TaxID=116188 RepID=UPI0033ABA91F
MGEMINADGVELWVERRGEGPDVLLVSGLGDPAEAWQAQLDGLADRYPAHGLRQPWRRAYAAALGAALLGADGR